MKEIHKHFTSSLITIAVIAMLFISGPAGAIDIKIEGLKGDYKQDKQIQFTVDTRINHGGTEGELLTNLQYAEIKFTKDDSEWSETCKVYLNKSVEGCNFLYVKDIKITGEYGQGYGYGYDDDELYGLGYGYGYGYNDSGAHIKYKLVVNSSLLDAGKYYAATDVYAGAPTVHAFSSEEETKFTIFTKKPKHHDDDEEEDDHDEDGHGHKHITSDDVHLDVNTNTSANGNVTIDHYDDSPVGSSKNHRSLGKFIDINSDENITDNLENATLRIHYSDSEIRGINENSLGIYYWNTSSEEWELVGNVHGSDGEKYISATLHHFSIYALFGDEIPKRPEYVSSSNVKRSENKVLEQPKVRLEAPNVSSIEALKEEPKKEPQKAEEKRSTATPPTGRLIGASGAAGVAAAITLFAGGFYMKKKGII